MSEEFKNHDYQSENIKNRSEHLEKTEDELRIEQALTALLSGEKAKQVAANLKMYRDAGRGCRTSIFHENIDPALETMLMSNEVYDKLKSLRNETESKQKEFAFIAFGFVTKGNLCFNNIKTDLDISDETREEFYRKNPACRPEVDSAVDFNCALNTYYQDIRNQVDGIKWGDGYQPLLALGHTHPNQSESYGNYSLPDLVGMFLQEQVMNDAVDGDFQFCHIVLPENGDVDCMIYDANQNKFQKVVEAFAIGESDETKIQTYTFQSPSELNNASYTVGDSEAEDSRTYNRIIDEMLEKFA